MRYATFLFFLFISTSSCISPHPSNNDLDKIDLSKNVVLIDELPLFPIDTFVDSRDNSKYATIKIGSQTWIQYFITYKATKGNQFKGNLYDWDAATNACPATYTIPSNDDWSSLIGFVYDSIIKKSSPLLIEKLKNSASLNCCDKYKSNQQNFLSNSPFLLDSIVNNLGKYSYIDVTENNEDELKLVFIYLENLGFCIHGSGFKYNRGTGVDDYSYFWTSSIDSSGDHQKISFYNGGYCNGCGYKFGMSNNNKNGFNLKCLKKDKP